MHCHRNSDGRDRDGAHPDPNPPPQAGEGREGADVSIDTTKLTPLANLVQRLTGVLVPTNKAIVGSGLYQIESGIIASWFKNRGVQTKRRQNRL